MNTVSLKITFQTRQEFRLPTLPNFLLSDTGVSAGIESFTEEQLREVGKQWTEALVQKARDRYLAGN